MNKITIGLVGPIASGKGEVAKYLASHGFTVFSLSDRVREEVALRGIPPTRENLQNTGNELRCNFGPQVLAERTLMLVGSSDRVVIDSIRNPSEIGYLQQHLDISIIGITASVEQRLEWYLRRSLRQNEDRLTIEDFLLANARDMGVGEDISGQQVSLCLEMSDTVIQNDGSKKHLLEEVDYFLISRFGISLEGARRSIEK